MLRAADIMTENVFTVQDSATVAQAIALMQEQRLRSLIVERHSEEDRYGIVTERDVVYKVLAPEVDPSQVEVHEIMRKPCIVVHPEMTIQEVAQLFSDTGIQRAPVIQDGTLSGVISVTDILMKTVVEEQPPADTLSQRIEAALRHARVLQDRQAQIEQECAIAWDIVEELQAEASHQQTLQGF